VRKLTLLVALCALLVIALVWFGHSGRGVPLEVPERAATVDVPAPTPALAQEAVTRLIDAPPPVQREVVAAAPEPAALARPVDTSIVFGLVVDGDDRPLTGVVVRLCAWKVWAEGVDVPRLSGKYDHRGWELTTGADGRFRFDVPTPTVEQTWLTLEPDPFHDSARVFFGGKNPGARARLHAGDNDMGTTRLIATGAIRGSVRDESGAPIAEARLVPGSERSTTISREATTDAGGNFVAGHLPAGPIGINAQAESFLSEFRKPIEVVLDRYTDHVDFVLRKAPSLGGTVVDDTGKPIEGVKLWGWPKSSGAGAGGKTLVDGSFTIYLPQDEPYTMEATRDGFEPFGVGDRSTTYAPGARDLRFVMKRLDASTLLVIDARTSQPITKFGHEVLPNMSDHTEHSSYTGVRTPTPVKHPDGRVAVSFRPGIDVVDVGAPGYESQRFDPKPGVPPDGVFVVKLVQTAGVSGRVQVAGVPVAGITIRLERGRMDRLGKGESESTTRRFMPDRDGASLGTSAADGSFLLEAAQSGMYRLIARSSSGEVASVKPFSVKSGKAVDLGTIDLVTGATIRGTVLVPAGRSVAGLTIRIDEQRFGAEQPTNAEGRFRFEGQSAGTHWLFVDDASGAIAEVPPVEVQLSAGEVRDVEIDARNHGTCSVELTILIGGRPAANASVELVRDKKPGRGLSGNMRLGNTDKDGHIVASAPLARGLAVAINTPDDLRFEHPTARLDLTLDARIVETIRFETGSIVLVLPPALSLPKKSNVRLELTSPGAGGGAFPMSRSLDLVNGATENARAHATDGGHQLRFDDVLAGDWQIKFDVSDQDDPMEKVQIDARSYETRRKTVCSATGTAQLTPGQTVTVELH
jgi:hypothetical protein